MNVEDLVVYKKLFSLGLDIYRITLEFPKFELYELGSQLRRSSSSPAANLAEGFNNKHTNIYLESISRACGEIRETIHHLKVAYAKGYVDEQCYQQYADSFHECIKMLYGLESSLKSNQRK